MSAPGRGQGGGSGAAEPPFGVVSEICSLRNSAPPRTRVASRIRSRVGPGVGPGHSERADDRTTWRRDLRCGGPAADRSGESASAASRWFYASRAWKARAEREATGRSVVSWARPWQARDGASAVLTARSRAPGSIRAKLTSGDRTSEGDRVPVEPDVLSSAERPMDWRPSSVVKARSEDPGYVRQHGRRWPTGVDGLGRGK
jgi:hypothetical protein